MQQCDDIVDHTELSKRPEHYNGGSANSAKLGTFITLQSIPGHSSRPQYCFSLVVTFLQKVFSILYVGLHYRLCAITEKISNRLNKINDMRYSKFQKNLVNLHRSNTLRRSVTTIGFARECLTEHASGRIVGLGPSAHCQNYQSRSTMGGNPARC